MKKIIGTALVAFTSLIVVAVMLVPSGALEGVAARRAQAVSDARQGR